MEAFPEDYVVHNLPLIVLSGLGNENNDKTAGKETRNLLSEGGFRIRTDIPSVTTNTAQLLLDALLSHDAIDKPWHGRDMGKTQQSGAFRIRCSGRNYTLPPRKAPPPAHSPRLRPAMAANSPPPQLILHSPISPLTPSSPLYPDGLMTPLWVTKHQSRLPSMFMTFFTLITDPNTSTLQDNKLKSEINNIRSVLTSTNYKTKLVVVLIGENYIDASDADERVNNIRRAINLDTKSLFYLPADSSQNEVSDFSKDMLNGLYASCVEYYRDLSKHARRKRNRNIVPQPTIQPTSGTSQTLALPGWNVRYEFKLGVFAEFRQEIEAAQRNYETAYEGLFGAEVFETIPSWSPKFNEARLLSDIIAIRSIRCLLWLGQTTNAVRWWSNHRNRIQSLIDRRGAGSKTYGWEAWQSIWSRTMSDMIQRSQALANPEHKISELSALPLFINAERNLTTGQRHTPWENLHHEGYWLNLAQSYTQNRRTRALQMPEEDRASPGQSPASIIASKAHLYDKYLTLEPYQELPLEGKPGHDYVLDIVRNLDAAVEHFSQRGQTRMIEILQLKKACELMKSQSWSEATLILYGIWKSPLWRDAGWWLLLEEIGRVLIACAVKVDQTDLIADLQWQLVHPVLGRQGQQPGSGSRTEITKELVKFRAGLDTEHSLAQLTPAFAFATVEGHVGETMVAQLALQHLVLGSSTSLGLSQVKVVFDGGLQPIYLVHDYDQGANGDSDAVIISEVELEDARSRVEVRRRSSTGAGAAMVAGVNLALRPGQVKVFQMQLIPREAGEVSVASITMSFQQDECEMTITTTKSYNGLGRWWELRRGKPISRLCGSQRDVSTATVLPKPPKIDIHLQDLQKVFYTNESIDLTIRTENREDQAVTGTIEIKLLSPGKNNTVLKLEDTQSSVVETVSDAVSFVQSLPLLEMKEVAVGSSTKSLISINNTDEAIDHELEIVINYALISTPETKLTKLLTVDITIVRPFEANFSFYSRHHQESWPDFFSAKTISESPAEAGGIKQQYLITAVICSFALEDIVIESTYLAPQKIVGDATCYITHGTLRQAGVGPDDEAKSSTLIHPEETKKFSFDMTLQKVVLGHRQPVAVDVLLEVRWKRAGSGRINTSVLQVPRFLAASAEPRVLLQAEKDHSLSGLYRLKYTIENPSLHFLTFNLTMESSDDFAFSGNKSKSISLVPISRHDIVFKILSNKSKAWIRVHLDVVDAYFGQMLRIQPASDGVRVDKQGNVLIWVEQ